VISAGAANSFQQYYFVNFLDFFVSVVVRPGLDAVYEASSTYIACLHVSIQSHTALELSHCFPTPRCTGVRWKCAL
jgi:hypothetical protein